MRGIPERPGAKQALKKAHRLAWLSIAYILSTIVMLFFVMSGSQALKTEMSGEILSLIPPSLFLIGDRVSRRPPNRLYPFGHERAVSAGYVGASVALLLVGVYLLFDGGMKLAMREHPTIGGFPLFGHVVWTGWLGIAVLLWSGIPAHFLGHAKRKCAEVLYDKTLAADADINAADWQSAAAAIVGLLGVGLGLWWADSAAAVLISLEIMRSGWTELRTALGDVMDRRPKTLDQKDDDPLPDKITDFIKRQPWVDDVIVRVRERGRELTAEAHVVPNSANVSVDEVSKAGELACKIDPRLADVTIAPVKAIPEDIAKAREPQLP
jgi:cation diffusion facilitator family transporter